MKVRRVPAVLAASLALFGAAACTSSDASSNDRGSSAPSTGDIVIGLVVDQTGVSAEIANPTLAGIQAHIKTINDAGGIGGRKIKVNRVADSQSTAEGAQAAFRDVLQDKPTAILGSINSLGIAAVPPIAGPANVPVLIGSAPDSIMLPEPPEWLFSQVMSAASMLDVSLDYLDQTLEGGIKGKRLAVTATASGFGDGYAKAFEDRAEELGYEIAILDRHPLQMSSFATNATQIVGKNADALLLLDVPSQTPMIVKDLVAAGFEGPIVGYESASEPTIIAAVANPQYVTFRGAPVPAEDGELAEAGKDAGFSDMVDSSWFSYGWNEVAVLAQALEDCNCSGKDLMKAIEGVSGLTPAGGSSYGPLAYSAEKHAGTTTVQFYTWDVAAKAETKTGEQVTLGS